MNSLYDVVSPVLGVVNAMVLVLVLVFVLRGPARKFWVVLVYVGWELLATAALTIADILFHGTANVTQATRTVAQAWYIRTYWTNDVIVDLMRFTLVIVLIYKAVDRPSAALSRLLAIIVIAMIVLPFVLFHPTFNPYPKTSWFNSTSQLLNFGAAIMNLMLWGTLLAAKKRDPHVLMVSLGLGVVVTGTALSYGIAYLLPKDASLGIPGLFLAVVQLIGWSIWCRAFWPVSKTRPAPHGPMVTR